MYIGRLTHADRWSLFRQLWLRKRLPVAVVDDAAFEAMVVQLSQNFTGSTITDAVQSIAFGGSIASSKILLLRCDELPQPECQVQVLSLLLYCQCSYYYSNC